MDLTISSETGSYQKQLLQQPVTQGHMNPCLSTESRPRALLKQLVMAKSGGPTINNKKLLMFLIKIQNVAITSSPALVNNVSHLQNTVSMPMYTCLFQLQLVTRLDRSLFSKKASMTSTHSPLYIWLLLSYTTHPLQKLVQKRTHVNNIEHGSACLPETRHNQFDIDVRRTKSKNKTLIFSAQRQLILGR